MCVGSLNRHHMNERGSGRLIKRVESPNTYLLISPILYPDGCLIISQGSPRCFIVLIGKLLGLLTYLDDLGSLVVVDSYYD